MDKSRTRRQGSPEGISRSDYRILGLNKQKSTNLTDCALLKHAGTNFGRTRAPAR